MTVDYQLEQADFIAFSKEHTRFVSDSLPRIYYYTVLPALGVGLAIATESLPIAALFTLLYMSSAWGFQTWIHKRYRSSIYSEDNLAFSTRRYQATLTEEGVTFSTDASVALYRWAFIREVFRGAHYIYFVLTPLYRIHVPTRAFKDEDHLKQFLAAAQSHVNPR